MLYIASTSAVSAEAENPSFWSWVKDKANEISSTATEKASDASSYISKSYYEAVDGSVAWTKETYNDFSTDYPEIATNIESFASSTSEYSNYAYEKTKDGALVAYEVTADGTKTAVDWTSKKISKVPEITACDIANYDFAGGVAVGTLNYCYGCWNDDYNNSCNSSSSHTFSTSSCVYINFCCCCSSYSCRCNGYCIGRSNSLRNFKRCLLLSVKKRW